MSLHCHTHRRRGSRQCCTRIPPAKKGISTGTAKSTNAYVSVVLVDGRVRLVVCDLDDASRATVRAARHRDKMLAVARPRHAIHLEHYGQNKKGQNNAYIGVTLDVYTVSCVTMLVMQSDLSWLPDATSVPSGEIAHPLTCTSIVSIRAAAYNTLL